MLWGLRGDPITADRPIWGPPLIKKTPKWQSALKATDPRVLLLVLLKLLGEHLPTSLSPRLVMPAAGLSVLLVPTAGLSELLSHAAELAPDGMRLFTEGEGEAALCRHGDNLSSNKWRI